MIAPPQIRLADSVAEVLDGLAIVTQWAHDQASRIGYFASLYRRITTSIGDAIESGEFEHPNLVKRIDPVFANHYLRALDVFFRANRSP